MVMLKNEGGRQEVLFLPQTLAGPALVLGLIVLVDVVRVFGRDLVLGLESLPRISARQRHGLLLLCL